MERICHSLVQDGWEVTLVGRKSPSSKPLAERNYRQHRFNMFFRKGKCFYLEYNVRLLFYLLKAHTDVIIAIDLDTIIPVYWASKWKKTERIYDAHELFSEMKEVITRPFIHKCWRWVEKTFVPRFPHGYTVSGSIVSELNQRYGVNYALIRNLPLYEENAAPQPTAGEKFLIYQGAVNEGRCLEWLIPAMKQVDMPLRIYGDGNYADQCRKLIREHGLELKITMMGSVRPEELRKISAQAYVGINLIEPLGLNQVYSLANKFFDYVHAGIPQLTMDFPEYRKINDEYRVAVLIKAPDPEIIAAGLNKLLENEVFYQDLKHNCKHAARLLNWQSEERRLKDYYHKILD
jgi:glycosyltransferase involved in cell wall biosynthesis